MNITQRQLRFSFSLLDKNYLFWFIGQLLELQREARYRHFMNENADITLYWYRRVSVKLVCLSLSSPFPPSFSSLRFSGTKSFINSRPIVAFTPTTLRLPRQTKFAYQPRMYGRMHRLRYIWLLCNKILVKKKFVLSWLNYFASFRKTMKIVEHMREIIS